MSPIIPDPPRDDDDAVIRELEAAADRLRGETALLTASARKLRAAIDAERAR